MRVILLNKCTIFRQFCLKKIMVLIKPYHFYVAVSNLFAINYNAMYLPV